jgi:hypothetical protein
MCIIENEVINLEDLMNYYLQRLNNDQTNINRIKRLYNDDESFDLLMNKIINKDGKRFEKLIAGEKNPKNPWRILFIILDIAQEEGTETDPFDTLTKMLPSKTVIYHGWTFSWVHGEETSISVYNRKNELIYRF